MHDTLFSFIEALQGETPWGRVLDAGTGRHSLEWISRLQTTHWCAVTCGEKHARDLEREFGERRRATDRFAAGNWTDAAFLHGEVYDVVVADYLLGSVDRFAPYFQDRLFARLRPHVGSRLYVVGLEPYPGDADTPGGSVVLEIARLRDACILLAGDRCYREYPEEWTIRCLERSGFVVEESRAFPIRYDADFINGQLDVCVRKLPRIADRQLAGALEPAIRSLRERALALYEAHRGIGFGRDYVIYARPQ